ncbi:MAG: radical SAM protein [Candidatus Margulisiibacteriota bacterium]
MHGKVFKMLHVEIDRGCPYNCTYCAAPSLKKMYAANNCGNYFRQKRSGRIIDEMIYLKDKYQPNYIDFNAESFLARDINELKDFAVRYKTKIGLPFWCQSRTETVTEEKISVLKDMGCTDLQFGIEHGNEEFRKRVLNRHQSNGGMLKALKIVEKYGIPYSVNNIIGFPNETRELMFDTIEFNRLINPKTMNCYILTPYSGTPIRDYCVDNGLLDRDAKTEQLLDGADIKNPYVNRNELKGIQRTFSLYARLPKDRWPEIKLAESFDARGETAFEKLTEEFHNKFF